MGTYPQCLFSLKKVVVSESAVWECVILGMLFNLNSTDVQETNPRIPYATIVVPTARGG